jgi:DNA-nicking Smr family endonuclease
MPDNQHRLDPRDLRLWQWYTARLKDDRQYVPHKTAYSEADTRRLDLHGCTLHEAWQRFREFVEYHHLQGHSSVVVITGRSGQIAREFREWCRLMPVVRKYEPLGHNNGAPGSFRVTLKKISSTK